jgi:hypothetical protein
MAKKHIVTVTEEERECLRQMLSSGKEGVRKLTRAWILLKADEGWTDKAIHEALDVGLSTVERTRRRFVEEGLEAALNRRPSTHRYEHKLDGNAEAHLIAPACSSPPAGSLCASPYHDRQTGAAQCPITPWLGRELFSP